MFGPSSSLLLKLQGEYGEWRENEEVDEWEFEDYEPEPVLLKRQLALSDEAAFSVPHRDKGFEALLLAKQSQESGCSICLDTEASDLHRLRCGHAFCGDCIAEYLRQKIRSREIDRRQKTWLAPLASEKVSGARLHVELSYGIHCPHLGCAQLIEVDYIRDFVDSNTYDIYDRHALHQTLDNMNSLRKCPLRCGGWIQEGCLCTDAECLKRQILKQKIVESHINLGKWAQTVGAKCCPQCYAPIEKNMGCDHMYCITCKTRFNWSQAPLFGTGKHWYRPENASEEVELLFGQRGRSVIKI